MSAHPIPTAALDDRLGFVGTAGSGKTYNAGSCIERLLDASARVVIVDPLDVWWGLRLVADGSSESRYRMPIFGGAHGDLPLTEAAGAVIGETVAGMAESCIVSLGGLQTKASERRFMLAFLDTIYRKASGEPVHLIFDEADLWAPQKSSEPMLQSRMEEICRRGRVKGLIPWLITQRPAVISKDVLSQVDGLVAFKLTSSQDRDALEGWIEGQADRAAWKAIRAQLPTMERGQGVVWLPGRNILDTAKFPVKRTFDSSRTPKRGEKTRAATLKPLDLGALKARLATVEVEAKTADPKALRAEVARLTAELQKAQQNITGNITDAHAVAAADAAGYHRGLNVGHDGGWKAGWPEGFKAGAAAGWGAALERIEHATGPLRGDGAVWRSLPMPTTPDALGGPPPVAPSQITPPTGLPKAPSQVRRSVENGLSPTLQRVLDAIAFWAALGFDPVERKRACIAARLSPKASTFGVYIADLIRRDLVVATPGAVGLTDAGRGAANHPAAMPTAADIKDAAVSLLDHREAGVFNAIYAAYPNAIARNAVADKVGLSRTASTVGVYIAACSGVMLVENAGPGQVRAADWLFPRR